jgi:hypothetical protein
MSMGPFGAAEAGTGDSIREADCVAMSDLAWIVLIRTFSTD